MYPCDDLRVLDLSRVVAGPIAARMLADLGADVVKVEPPEGDITRSWGHVRHGISGWFTQQNVGKRNVCVDVKTEEGVEVVRRLAAQADIVIENFRPGVLARLGLDYEVLRTVNPDVVMLSVTGFGQRGPEQHRPAYAPVIHAETGFLARQAEFDGVLPSDPILSIADTNAGLHGLIAIFAALRLRDRMGTGQHIDLAMHDAMLATDDYAHYALDEEPIVRLGGRVFDAPGGPILLAGEMKYLWAALSRAHGIDDPAPGAVPIPDKARLRRAALDEWVAGFGDRAELKVALDAARVPWGDVNSTAAAFVSPTAADRGTVAEIDDRAGGRRRVVQSPYRFSAATSGVHGVAAYRGEHNADVLTTWAAYTEAEVATLESSGVLVAEPR
ncbi:MAG TPA: CoA transferase [Acidimicrobiales bacterium]|nr:CoA transferase [Acidimicrobiales bacterium]